MANDVETVNAHNASGAHSRQRMFLADVVRPDSGVLARATQNVNAGKRWIMVPDKLNGGLKRKFVKTKGKGDAAAGAALPAASAVKTVAAAPAAPSGEGAGDA